MVQLTQINKLLTTSQTHVKDSSPLVPLVVTGQEVKQERAAITAKRSDYNDR